MAAACQRTVPLERALAAGAWRDVLRAATTVRRSDLPKLLPVLATVMAYERLDQPEKAWIAAEPLRHARSARRPALRALVRWVREYEFEHRTSPPVAQLFVEALRLAGQRQEALDIADHAVLLDPQDPFSYLVRARVCLELRKLDRAIDDCSQAIRLKPDFGLAYALRGSCLVASGYIPEAIEDFTRAIQCTPHYAGAYVFRANTKAMSGDMEGADRDYAQAIAAGARPAEVYLNKGAALSEVLHDHRAAIAEFTRAIEADPNYADAYYNRAIAHLRLGETDAALADLARAIAADPSHAPAFLVRGNIYYANRCYHDAIDDYSAAIAADDLLAEAYCNRGIARAAIADFQHALADLKKAVTLRPSSAAIHYDYAIALDAAGKWQQSVEHFTKAIKLGMSLPSAYLYRGRALQALGHLQDAIVDLKKATRLDPQFADAWYALSLAYDQIGKPKLAAKALARYRALSKAMAPPPTPQPSDTAVIAQWAEAVGASLVAPPEAVPEEEIPEAGGTPGKVQQPGPRWFR